MCGGLSALVLSGPPVGHKLEEGGGQSTWSCASGLGSPSRPTCQSPAAVSVWFWQGCLGRGCPCLDRDQSQGVLFAGEVAGVSGCLRPRPAGTSGEGHTDQSRGEVGIFSLQGPFPCLPAVAGLPGGEDHDTGMGSFSSPFLSRPRAGAVTGHRLPPWGSSCSQPSSPRGSHVCE